MLKVLSKNAPVKKHYIRANEATFMNKALKKAIIKISQLRNVFLKKRTLESQVAYTVQRNYCTRLLRKEKQNYFEKIDTSKISDNKMFWKTVKPIFSKKNVNRESITLVKDDEILSENLEVTKIFNAFFSNMVKEMNISLGQELLNEVDYIEDPVLRIIGRFKKYSSVVAIFENRKNSDFSDRHESLD